MRILYFDCFSGISGDMTLGALVDAGVDVDFIAEQLSTLHLNASLESTRVKKSGFAATQVRIATEPEHAHRHLKHIREIISQSDISDAARETALKIFHKLAEAEAAAHGSTIEKVHFHEVGAVDSIMDIVGTAVALDCLSLDKIVCSPVPTGTGTVTGAHGVMPIPAPGTAALLKGIPVRNLAIEAELTTPTGAAIVAAMATEFGSLPSMTVEQVGYGAGTRDLAEQANLLRVFVGQVNDDGGSETERDQVWVLETNLDDVSSEWIGYCSERLFDHGALDVYTSALGMKKNRPGILLAVICSEAKRSNLERIIFQETATLGIRRVLMDRTTLRRESRDVNTRFGVVRGKLATLPGGCTAFAPEFESCRDIAIRANVAVREIYLEAMSVYENRSE